jgi:uncharacterized protein YjbI with pentapeptide repeats/8-oxo-dGTP pyrophosphatase MutT (NUDIX family)
VAPKKPRPNAAFLIAGILAHAKATRETGKRLALPDDLRDLSGIDLRGADLTGANLEGANLNGASLAGADLSYADLRGANFTDADLTGAILYGADLRGADLTGTDLTGASLAGAKLNGASLAGAKLNGASLAFAKLSYIHLHGADLRGANLRGASLTGANLYKALLNGTSLAFADLSYADLRGANFTDADLSYADLSYAYLTGADFTDADITSVKLNGADLSGVDLSKAENGPRFGSLKEHYKTKAPSSAAFKRWFGQSVVVGDKKKPIVVYHGTSQGGFIAFDPNERDAHHNAFYFTDSADVAETYTDATLPEERPDPALTNDTVGIYRLYVRLVNPMIVDANNHVWDDLSDPRAPNLSKTYELAAWAEKNGYDGVIFKNIVDDGGRGARKAKPATVYAVFDPRAIKSATANNGKYNPNDPDIRHNPAIEPSSVATLVFDRQGRVLILRRGPTAPWMPGKWSLPGGTVDPGETLLQAAVREAVEETTLKVKRAHPLTVIEHKPGGWSAAFFVSYPGDWSGKVKLDYENDAFAWISESDIPRYSFIPTVIRALRLGFKGLRK